MMRTHGLITLHGLISVVVEVVVDIRRILGDGQRSNIFIVFVYRATPHGPAVAAISVSPCPFRAGEVRRRTLGQRRRVQLMPPRFFVAADSVVCGLAFAHARQGRASVIQEDFQ